MIVHQNKQNIKQWSFFILCMSFYAVFFVNTAHAQNLLTRDGVNEFYQAEIAAKLAGAEEFIEFRKVNYSDDLHEIMHIVRNVDGEEQDPQTVERDKAGMMRTLEYSAKMMTYHEATSEVIGATISADGKFISSQVRVTGRLTMKWPGVRIQGKVREDGICDGVFRVSPDSGALQILKSECVVDLQIIERVVPR